MVANNGIWARKAAISQAQPERYTTIRKAAEALSRRTVDQAVTELLNEAHSRLILLCYERDDTGRLVNVDERTGKVLIPLPWGKKGYAKWGLSPSEADCMRRVMFARQRTGLPLFRFDHSRRSWFLNLASYPVLPVLAEWEIGVGEYRAARSG